jgi:hypothetical protein
MTYQPLDQTPDLPGNAPGLAGYNELHLNAATMQAVVQFWLDRWATTPTEVRGISYNSWTASFIIKTGPQVA